MVHISYKVLVPEYRVENVVHVDRQDSQEPRCPSCVDGVAGVVLAGPGIGPVFQASASQEAQYLPVWIFFTTQEDEVL